MKKNPSYDVRWKLRSGKARPASLALTLGAAMAISAVAWGQTAPNVSINSTSQNSSEVGVNPYSVGPVPEQPLVGGSGYQVVAINDLGMHCGDFDTRIVNVLPPFQVLLAQVIRKGATPQLLGPEEVDLVYSAASNPDDPILTKINPDPFSGLQSNGEVYKTNFWDNVAAYDPFYPPGILCSPNPSSSADCIVPPDVSLPVPNVEDLYIGPDGLVNSGDEFLSAVQHNMPGIGSPYLANDPQPAEEFYEDKPFFVNFPFGYVADDLHWFEGAGVPYAAFDDFGRENAYPLVRVQAKSKSGTTLASVDTVLPISGEASCKNCHGSTEDVPVSPQTPNAGIATEPLIAAGIAVATAFDDDPGYGELPSIVSVEYATDINVLRLHDLKHGPKYVDSAGAQTPCSIDSANPNGNANCLANKAVLQSEPVVCQVCHYTPALDLAQFGPLGGDPSINDAAANGRVQRAHETNSAVMHYHHGTLTKAGGQKLFPDMPPPAQNADGAITNQGERLAALEQTCYQCHPGTNTECLRGAMFNGGMLCNDCHGSMVQVGDDFSRGVSPSNPNDFKIGLGNFYDPANPQPRVPWANEPGCGSCHTGDAVDNLAGGSNVITNFKDVYGNTDNIRLLQAYRNGDAKATPIVPDNKRFAENTIPAQFNGFDNPGAGNPKLYRVSTGHGGVFCEGCHGATHAEWPNANPNANDNVTAKQLQGHTGVLIECTTCHGNALDRYEGLGGPHGMHTVGSTRFVNGGHEDLIEYQLNDDLSACSTCHGDRGQGTVLSVVKARRVGLECESDGTGCRDGRITLEVGTAVDCGLCHENPYEERKYRDGDHHYSSYDSKDHHH